MPDGVVSISVVIGFGFIIFAGARLGAGSLQAFGGLFAAQGVRDWPTGIQEGDAPRFDVQHLDELRPGRPEVIATSSIADDVVDGPCTELVELGSRRLGTPPA
jgi:hypothetical protein